MGAGENKDNKQTNKHTQKSEKIKNTQCFQIGGKLIRESKWKTGGAFEVLGAGPGTCIPVARSRGDGTKKK